jgi:site-specific DNA recombinase
VGTPRTAWSKGAVHTILGNPRYTGRQVWNKQRKDEVLIDVEDVALGHITKMRWNDKDTWVWSTDPAHEPLIETETFERVQEVLAGRGAGRDTRERVRVRRLYTLRGLVSCGICRRRMQSQWNHDEPYYRCRFPNEYGLANKIQHPRNVYLAEREALLHSAIGHPSWSHLTHPEATQQASDARFVMVLQGAC